MKKAGIRFFMKNRNYNLDIIRIIACIGVVLLHTIGFKGSTVNSCIYYIGTISLPLFFMVSGYCILQKENITAKYVLEKVANILILIFIWSILFGIKHFILEKKMFETFAIFIGSIKQENDLSIMWFLWAIMIMYVISPLLLKLIKSRYNKLILNILVIFSSSIFLLNILLKIKYDFIIQEKVFQTLRLWTWITYFYFGGMIGTNNLKNNSKKSSTAILIILVVFIVYEYNIAKYIFIDKRCENFYDSVIIKVLCFLVFTNILNIKINEKYNKLITILSKATLGVYILQIPFLKVVGKVYNFKNTLLNVVGLVLITFILFISAIIINNMKYIKNIINTNFIKLNNKKKVEYEQKK